jgi:uncharacterized membrane protein
MNEVNKTIWVQIRTTLVRGSIVIIPVALTYWFFRALLNAIDGILSPFLETWIGREIPGIGLAAMVLLVLIVGLLARNYVGRILFGWFEDLLGNIPLVRSVYGAVKDLVGAFTLGGKGKTFREVVLIEYPRAGLYTIAFVTNEMKYVNAGNQEIEFVNVYIPNPPNPTSGVLILVPRNDAIRLNLTIEQGLKLVLSGGIVTPERLEQFKSA